MEKKLYLQIQVGIIYETTDYSIFKSHFLNRTIVPKHVKHLKKLMIKNGWNLDSDISVFEDGELANGHHRLMAAKELGIPIRYKIIPKKDDTLMVSSNQGQMPWSFKNHSDTFCKLGYTEYKVLNQFMEDFPAFSMTECQMLLRNNTSSGVRDMFEDGEFKVKDLDLAYKWGNYIMQLKPYFPRFYNKSAFIRALVRIFINRPEFIFEEFLRKVELRPGIVKPNSSLKQYIEMIEEAYNYHRRDVEKINLRFMKS